LQKRLGDEITLTVEEEKQDVPFEVVFDKWGRTDFFDLDEIPEKLLTAEQLKRMKSPTMLD
jgi:hypothetical protein